MAISVDSKVVFIATLVVSFTLFLQAKADVRAVNQCPYDLTVFHQSQSTQRVQLIVPAGSSQQLNLPTPWTGGVMWASQTANSNNGQATQLEFNIGPTRDYYDISLVNAYNEPAMIKVTSVVGGDVVSGLECGTVSCSISNLDSVCRLDNIFASDDSNACINTDGPGLVDTPSIDLFRNACPNVYVQSNDNTNVVYACNTGANYDAVWCP